VKEKEKRAGGAGCEGRKKAYFRKEKVPIGKRKKNRPHLVWGIGEK